MSYRVSLIPGTTWGDWNIDSYGSIVELARDFLLHPYGGPWKCSAPDWPTALKFAKLLQDHGWPMPEDFWVFYVGPPEGSVEQLVHPTIEEIRAKAHAT